MTEQQKPIPIRNLDPNLYHQARQAALKVKQSVGTWISRAIKERLERENINRP